MNPCEKRRRETGAWKGKWQGVVFLFVVLMMPSGALAGGGQGCGKATMASAEPPLFHDDLDYQGLQSAIDRSMAYLARLPPERRFNLCGAAHPVSVLRSALETFAESIADHPSPRVLDERLHQRFSVCQAFGQDGQGGMLVTGYFEPSPRASLIKTETFRYPLHRTPPDLLSITNGGTTTVGRRENGTLVPYWSRAEIEQKNLLAGHELVWLADPVDAFILHVQGSGRVVLPDGTERRVQFAAKNGREYRSIGKLLVERGVMPLSEVTLPRIVEYLHAHPGEQQEILHHNQSYIFFRWGDNSAAGPQGCLAEPLTASRSVAMDQACFPGGALGFLVSQKPIINANGEITGWQPMARFVLNQDTGSAIQGPGRLDLFLGAGSVAETTAGNLKHPGTLYFLLPRNPLLREKK